MAPIPTPPEKPRTKQERDLDDALAESFPASDPVASSTPHQSVRADKRHLAEHAAGSEGGESVKPARR